MNRMQKGFTLVELVITIVIIGILAAIAIPQYIDLTGSANTSAANGVAGALASASSINYAARKANASNGVAILNCQTVSSALAGGLPTGYTIGSLAITAGSSSTCTVSRGTTTATFVATGIS